MCGDSVEGIGIRDYINPRSCFAYFMCEVCEGATEYFLRFSQL